MRLAVLAVALLAVSAAALSFDGSAAVEPEMLTQQWVPASALTNAPEGMLAATSGDVCPAGWQRLWSKNTPLFMAFGMLTDESGSPLDSGGHPFSNFRTLVACVKE